MYKALTILDARPDLVKHSNHPLGLRDLAKEAGTPRRGQGWLLSMVEAYRRGVGVTEEKPASRDIPWRERKP